MLEAHEAFGITPSNNQTNQHSNYVQHVYLCYLIPQVSWYQAYVNCGLYGYKLATIESKEENENIVRQLKVQGNAG